MAWVALALAFFSLLVGLAALLAAKGACSTLDSGFRDLRRGVRNLEDELEHQLDVQRKLLARRIDGELVSSEMALDGRLWRDMDVPDAQRLIRDESELFILDVRTNPELDSTGKIPKAKHIPLDELEERKAEVPSGRKVLIYCAAGIRSAEACEYLSRQGHEDLFNLAGGLSSWPGPVESVSG